ncbi:hypothetical protein DES52_12525 [Deinococcus yavapaiensis KR-236]|uniref:Uncharacterized protein n=1 Tax=Deinococcus yavapaiensis KR-236 TaxID=694435 RepID=A0A318S5C9_9DEIO|nr:hypothetical protein DES52_12525 [Deinococcus yavapaiensis KR-236]
MKAVWILVTLALAAFLTLRVRHHGLDAPIQGALEGARPS